jgi:hypothetical protein
MLGVGSKGGLTDMGVVCGADQEESGSTRPCPKVMSAPVQVRGGGEPRHSCCVMLCSAISSPG